MSDQSTSDGLPLLDAARVLGVSEKTLRRRIKAGDVKGEKVSLDGGGLEWRVHLDGVPAIVPEVVPATNDRAGIVPDINLTVPEAQRTIATDVPEVSETRDGTVPEVVPERYTERWTDELFDDFRDTWTRTMQEREAELKSEIQFLRGVVEAQNRDAAELRAALREALKLSTKALPKSTSDAEISEAQPVQSTLESSPAQTELLEQIETLKANQEALRLETEWMARQMQTPPSPQKRGWFARWFGSD